MAGCATAAKAWPALTTPRIIHILLYSSFSIPPSCMLIPSPQTLDSFCASLRNFFSCCENVAHLVTDEIRRAFWTEGMAWRLKERAEKQNRWRRHVAS
jgi:hypothetical protein